MTFCKPECVIGIPNNDWTNGCNTKSRKGGIPRLTFLKCDETMVLPYPPAVGQTNPWTNLDNVKWALCNGFLFITAPILGQKPRGSFTKKRFNSCDPESVIAGSKTITFQDFNADNTDLIDYEFWPSIDANQKFMRLGWITCEDLWYMYDGAWSLEIDDVAEDTSDGNTFWDGVITMATKDVIAPVSVPGLKALLDSYSTSECYS